MTIFRQPLARRTFLRGTGAAVALPFLDAMVPAMTAHGGPLPSTRFAFQSLPHGAILDQ